VADRVDAAMQAVKPPRLHPTGHRGAPDPERAELPRRHHPPLTSRQLGERPLGGWAGLLTVCGSWTAHPSSVPMNV
jgi:hypothetical protein